MKTTLEIPDFVFRRSKAAAAELGIPLREFVTQAVKEKLAGTAHGSEKPWMEGFGKLRRLRMANAGMVICLFLRRDTARHGA